MGHNIDFHCITGPGGGASLTYAEQSQEKICSARMLQPGLYVYHCAAAPVPAHIANGMYGVVLVEPEDGLPKVCVSFTGFHSSDHFSSFRFLFILSACFSLFLYRH
jgi:nitrite reductase (NO-forming)